MKVRHHLVLSAAVSGGLFAWTGSAQAAIASFLAGVLPDIDHLLEYLAVMRGRFVLADFFSYFYGRRFKRLYLPLHAWEWLLGFAAAVWLTGGAPWAVGVALGYGHHLVTDHVRNALVNPAGYSLLYRAAHGFRRSAFLGDK